VSDSETAGRRVVLWMYAGAVATAGVFGYVLGVIVYGGSGGPVGPLVEGGTPEMGQVGPVVFELTPLNLAAFGVVSVGVMLGLGLAAIVFVSDREDAA